MTTRTVGSGQDHATIQAAIDWYVSNEPDFTGLGEQIIDVQDNITIGALDITGLTTGSDGYLVIQGQGDTVFTMSQALAFTTSANRYGVVRDCIVVPDTGFTGDRVIDLSYHVSLDFVKLRNPNNIDATGAWASASSSAALHKDSYAVGFDSSGRYGLRIGAADAQNCTAYDCYRGIYGNNSSTLIDCAAFANSNYDFAPSGARSFCASSDTSADGTGSITLLTGSDQYNDPLNYDLTLKVGNSIEGVSSNSGTIGFQIPIVEGPEITTYPLSIGSGETGVVVANVATGWGATQGSGRVLYGGVEMDITSWSDTSITFTSPAAASIQYSQLGYTLTVETDAGARSTTANTIKYVPAAGKWYLDVDANQAAIADPNSVFFGSTVGELTGTQYVYDTTTTYGGIGVHVTAEGYVTLDSVPEDDQSITGHLVSSSGVAGTTYTLSMESGVASPIVIPTLEDAFVPTSGEGVVFVYSTPITTGLNYDPDNTIITVDGVRRFWSGIKTVEGYEAGTAFLAVTEGSIEPNVLITVQYVNPGNGIVSIATGDDLASFGPIAAANNSIASVAGPTIIPQLVERFEKQQFFNYVDVAQFLTDNGTASTSPTWSIRPGDDGAEYTIDPVTGYLEPITPFDAISASEPTIKRVRVRATTIDGFGEATIEMSYRSIEPYTIDKHFTRKDRKRINHMKVAGLVNSDPSVNDLELMEAYFDAWGDMDKTLIKSYGFTSGFASVASHVNGDTMWETWLKDFSQFLYDNDIEAVAVSPNCPKILDRYQAEFTVMAAKSMWYAIQQGWLGEDAPAPADVFRDSQAMSAAAFYGGGSAHHLPRAELDHYIASVDNLQLSTRRMQVPEISNFSHEGVSEIQNLSADRQTSDLSTIENDTRLAESGMAQAPLGVFRPDGDPYYNLFFDANLSDDAGDIQGAMEFHKAGFLGDRAFVLDDTVTGLSDFSLELLGRDFPEQVFATNSIPAWRLAWIPDDVLGQDADLPQVTVADVERIVEGSKKRHDLEFQKKHLKTSIISRHRYWPYFSVPMYMNIYMMMSDLGFENLVWGHAGTDAAFMPLSDRYMQDPDGWLDPSPTTNPNVSIYVTSVVRNDADESIDLNGMYQKSGTHRWNAFNGTSFPIKTDLLIDGSFVNTSAIADGATQEGDQWCNPDKTPVFDMQPGSVIMANTSHGHRWAGHALRFGSSVCFGSLDEPGAGGMNMCGQWFSQLIRGYDAATAFSSSRNQFRQAFLIGDGLASPFYHQGIVKETPIMKTVYVNTMGNLPIGDGSIGSLAIGNTVVGGTPDLVSQTSRAFVPLDASLGASNTYTLTVDNGTGDATTTLSVTGNYATREAVVDALLAQVDVTDNFATTYVVWDKVYSGVEDNYALRGTMIYTDYINGYAGGVLGSIATTSGFTVGLASDYYDGFQQKTTSNIIGDTNNGVYDDSGNLIFQPLCMDFAANTAAAFGITNGGFGFLVAAPAEDTGYATVAALDGTPPRFSSVTIRSNNADTVASPQVPFEEVLYREDFSNWEHPGGAFSVIQLNDTNGAANRTIGLERGKTYVITVEFTAEDLGGGGGGTSIIESTTII